MRLKIASQKFNFVSSFRYIASLFLCSSVTAGPNPDNTPCGKYVEIIAHKTNVPPEVIWAVANAESNLGNLGPWPWSANFGGKSFYFKSQKELTNFIRNKLKKKRYLSIDIGCMQLNYVYHGHKFSNIYEMTNIYKNMLIGAKYLRELYEKSKQMNSRKHLPENRLWGYAVGDYHSQKALRGAKYIKRTTKLLMINPSWYDDILPDLDDAPTD